MEFADCDEPFCDEPSAVRYHDYVGHTLLTGSSGSLNQGLKNHPFQTDDAALLPIAKKVLGGERLDSREALALYRSPDILAVGWLANSVRERLHGDQTYFHVNRHINPTNVCVAA